MKKKLLIVIVFSFLFVFLYKNNKTSANITCSPDSEVVSPTTYSIKDSGANVTFRASNCLDPNQQYLLVELPPGVNVNNMNFVLAGGGINVIYGPVKSQDGSTLISTIDFSDWNNRYPNVFKVGTWQILACAIYNGTADCASNIVGVPQQVQVTGNVPGGIPSIKPIDNTQKCIFQGPNIPGDGIQVHGVVPGTSYHSWFSTDIESWFNNSPRDEDQWTQPDKSGSSTIARFSDSLYTLSDPQRWDNFYCVDVKGSNNEYQGQNCLRIYMLDNSWPGFYPSGDESCTNPKFPQDNRPHIVYPLKPQGHQYCQVRAGDSFTAQASNLVPGYTYYWWFEGDPISNILSNNPHVLGPVDAYGDPETFTITGTDTQNHAGQSENICIDIADTPYNSGNAGEVNVRNYDKQGRKGINCFPVQVITQGQANPACASEGPSTTPQPTQIQCQQENGYCTEASPGHTQFSCSQGYSPASSPQGCISQQGGAPGCCVPSCSKPGGECGINQGDNYCCHEFDPKNPTNVVCQQNSSHGNQQNSWGTCVGCSGSGGTCNDAKGTTCCTNQNLYCSSSFNGTCKTCLSLGSSCQSGSNDHCCQGSQCINGTCSSCHTEGLSCTNNSDCCTSQGLTCVQGGNNSSSCEPASATDTPACGNGGDCNLPAPSFAAFNTCPNGTCNTAIGDIHADPQTFITDLFRIALTVGGSIALIMIIYSGYQMILSAGKPEQLKQAQETLTAAIVGLLFIIFSMVILETIGVDILHIPGLGH